MSKPVNVFAMVHGMVIDLDPIDPFPNYASFWDALVKVRPELVELVAKRIGVQWGHDTSRRLEEGREIRDDEKLTEAQKFVGSRTNYGVVKKQPGPNNVVLTGTEGILEDIKEGPPWFPLFRGLLSDIRERVFVRGIADAVYYCSTEGETQIRLVVYEQILKELEEFSAEKDVRIHLLGHSLGVTVAHDFLYGLFGSPNPDFISTNQGSERGKELYKKWRAKVTKGELSLGSFTSTASQLPVFLMRKQRLVNDFYIGKGLNPALIGISSAEKIKWKLFYDADDVVGFPTRGLYEPNNALKEIQVGTGSTPEKAHGGYLTNREVIIETANLIYENSLE